MNSTRIRLGILLLLRAFASGFCLWDGAARAALTDEIQVYDAEINEVGQFSVELHNNFTAIGHHEPDFPGGIVPNHTLNGVPEWAYAYELSYNMPQWNQSRWAGEVRPIVGRRIGPVDIIFNPIFDTDFRGGIKSLDFVPCERLAYNFSKTWALALEHYEDYGRLNDLALLDQQDQTLFASGRLQGEPNSVEFGVGHSFTGGGECLVLKLMLTHNFGFSGKSVPE